MPNVNNPHGLRPIMRNFDGGPSEAREFSKTAAVATAIFRNDAVCIVTGATIQPGRATAFVGVSLDYGKASTLTQHRIIASPTAIFVAQDNDAAVGLLAADLGKNANLSTAVAGNAIQGISGMQIDKASVATTNTLDLMLLNLHPVPDNDFGPNARVEVLFNRHFFAPGRTGV